MIRRAFFVEWGSWQKNIKIGLAFTYGIRYYNKRWLVMFVTDQQNPFGGVAKYG